MNQLTVLETKQLQAFSLGLNFVFNGIHSLEIADGKTMTDNLDMSCTSTSTWVHMVCWEHYPFCRRQLESYNCQ